MVEPAGGYGGRGVRPSSVSAFMEIVAVADGVFRLGSSLDPSPAVVDPSASLGTLDTPAGRAVVEGERVSFFSGDSLVAEFEGLVKERQ